MADRHALLPFQPRDLPALQPMARRTDPATSHGAAGVVRPELGKIQRLVLEAFLTHGPMTAREAERLEEFDGYGFSTIRKRISELARERHLKTVGVDRSSGAPATIYVASTDTAGRSVRVDGSPGDEGRDRA